MSENIEVYNFDGKRMDNFSAMIVLNQLSVMEKDKRDKWFNGKVYINNKLIPLNKLFIKKERLFTLAYNRISIFFKSINIISKSDRIWDYNINKWVTFFYICGIKFLVKYSIVAGYPAKKYKVINKYRLLLWDIKKE